MHQLKYCIKYSVFKALLKASSLYSFCTGKGGLFQMSGAAAGKLTSPALQLDLGLLGCLFHTEQSGLVYV